MLSLRLPSFCLALTRTALFPALPLQEAGPLAAFTQGPFSFPITVPGHPLPFPTARGPQYYKLPHTLSAENHYHISTSRKVASRPPSAHLDSYKRLLPHFSPNTKFIPGSSFLAYCLALPPSISPPTPTPAPPPQRPRLAMKQNHSPLLPSAGTLLSQRWGSATGARGSSPQIFPISPLGQSLEHRYRFLNPPIASQRLNYKN